MKSNENKFDECWQILVIQVPSQDSSIKWKIGLKVFAPEENIQTHLETNTLTIGKY